MLHGEDFKGMKMTKITVIIFCLVLGSMPSIVLKTHIHLLLTRTL